MLRRLAVVAVACAATVPMFGGTASASCLDDLQAYPLTRSDASWSASDHYMNWVHFTGPATVVIEGDDLLHDVGTESTWRVRVAQDWVGNAVGATTGFADCVAG